MRFLIRKLILINLFFILLATQSLGCLSRIYKDQLPRATYYDRTPNLIMVQSDPSGAEIYINGIFTGYLTPCEIAVSGDFAKTKITLKKTGFLDKEVVVKRVSLSAGESVYENYGSPRVGLLGSCFYLFNVVSPETHFSFIPGEINEQLIPKDSGVYIELKGSEASLINVYIKDTFIDSVTPEGSFIKLPPGEYELRLVIPTESEQKIKIQVIPNTHFKISGMIIKKGGKRFIQLDKD